MQPIAKPTGADRNTGIVVDRLRNLKVISNNLLRTALASLPILIVVLLLADWLIGSRAFAGDLFRLSSVLAVAVELFVLDQLFRNLPEALELIWARDLLFAGSDPEHRDQEFIKFINAFEAALNSRWSAAVGLLGAVAGLGATYPVRYFLQSGVSPFNPAELLAYYLWGNAALVAAPLGYLLGLLSWRVVVIAVYISRLGRSFEIRLQPQHPDRCGGLKPIGNLCLIIALLLLAPAIFLSVWGFAITFFNASGEIYSQLWSGLFRQWLVLLSVLSLIAFLWPLYSLHLQMQKQRRKVQTELDDLAQRIDEISTELRTQAHALTPEQGGAKLKSLELMEKVYLENSRIPVWPIDWPTILKFSGAQAVPILSFLGTSEPVIKLVGSIITSTAK
ncbi:MAG TPA: hypothetical protein VJ020_09985 [Anaerolineales bacterium]|nr:hypothetical protein [Anaerolineales bacterium]